MKFHTEQAGLWLKPNTASQLKPVMPQADISTQNINIPEKFTDLRLPSMSLIPTKPVALS